MSEHVVLEGSAYVTIEDGFLYNLPRYIKMYGRIPFRVAKVPLKSFYVAYPVMKNAPWKAGTSVQC